MSVPPAIITLSTQQRMENNMNATVTVSQARQVIDQSVNDISTITNENAETIAYAINNEVQLRDYILGLPKSHDLDNCINFVDTVASKVSEISRYALFTLNSVFNFEAGNLAKAKELNAIVANTKPDYSLNNLVTRVIDANWSKDTFAEMRNSVAHQVEAILDEMSDTEIVAE